MRSFAWWALALLAGGAGLKLLVVLLEPRLTFHPPFGRQEPPGTPGLAFEPLDGTTVDGLRLRGWFLPAPAAPAGTRPLTVIHFHGNGENAADHAELAGRLHRLGCNVLLAEYRGYAGNPGSPSEQGLRLDGEAAWNAALARTGGTGSSVVLWGRSLGGAVAAHLAARGTPPAGLVLESSFTSVRELLRDSGSWLLWALSFFGSYRFDQAALLPRITAPLLVIHGTADEVVPVQHGRRLHDLAGGPRRFAPIENAGHNDMMARHGEAIWSAASRFLLEIDRGDAAGS